MSVRILITDDHAVVREGLRMILEAMGDMTVVGEALDGRDAIEKAETLKPDVIVMDIAMPEMNGIELAIHLNWIRPDTRILLISGQATAPALGGGWQP